MEARHQPFLLYCRVHIDKNYYYAFCIPSALTDGGQNRPRRSRSTPSIFANNARVKMGATSRDQLRCQKDEDAQVPRGKFEEPNSSWFIQSMPSWRNQGTELCLGTLSLHMSKQFDPARDPILTLNHAWFPIGSKSLCQESPRQTSCSLSTGPGSIPGIH